MISLLQQQAKTLYTAAPIASVLLARSIDLFTNASTSIKSPHRSISTTANLSTTSYSTDAHPHLHVQLEPLDAPNDGIFFLSLTRPEAKNAIGRQLLRELRDALHQLARERTTRCVVVRSTAPGVFCAGADLKERAGMTQQEAFQFVQDLRSTFSALDALPMPTIAAIDGYALGGGAELALACDIRVVGRNAQFAFPETRLAIIPGAGGTQRLPRVIGRSRAMELIYTGKKVDAEEAYQLGLADRITTVGGGGDGSGQQQQQQSVDDAALELAREIAQGGPVALRAAKQAIASGMNMDLASGLQLEEACYAKVLPTEDRLEGLKAFAEKRHPVFKGL